MCMFAPQKKSPRIGQWNGRRRSSRSEEPLLPQLNRCGALLRLGCVLATALGATLLAFVWGTPQPYRVGEISAHDLTARVSFEVVNEIETEQARHDAVQQVPPEERTEQRIAAVRDAIPPVIDKYPQGTLLVQRGQPITEAQYALLEVETDAYLNSRNLGEQLSRGVALFLLLTLAVDAGGHLRRPFPARPGARACPRWSASARWCLSRWSWACCSTRRRGTRSWCR